VITCFAVLGRLSKAAGGDRPPLALSKRRQVALGLLGESGLEEARRVGHEKARKCAKNRIRHPDPTQRKWLSEENG